MRSSRRVPVGGMVTLVLLVAGEGRAEELPVLRDLTAVIALHGLPCGGVVRSERKGDSDYVAVCQTGERYHIFVDSRGQVVVQRLSGPN